MDSYNHSEMVGSSSLSQSSIVNYGYFGFEDLLDPAPVALESGINLSKTLNTSQTSQSQQQTFGAPTTSQIPHLDHQQSPSDSVQNQPIQLTSNVITNLDKEVEINPDDPDIETESRVPSPKLLGSHGSRTFSSENSNSEKTMCPHCGKYITAVAGNVAEHIRTHTGEKPFVCSECGASFAARANLKAHIRFHTGEKPYMCGICGKTFAQSSHMRVHMRKHTGERPYECQECKRKYSTKTSFRNHMKIHKGELSYKCELCGRGFVCNSWLQDHYKVHSKNKPFQCEKCGKKYKDKSYVMKHKAQFCGNDGYKKRWKVPGVEKPKGRPPSLHKTNAKLTTNQKSTTPLKRGRKPKRKRNKVHRTSLRDEENILDEEPSEDTTLINKQASSLPATEEKDKEVYKQIKINNITSLCKTEFEGQKDDIPLYLGCDSNHISYDTCQVNVLENNTVHSLQHQPPENIMDHYKPESAGHHFSLDLELSDQNDILNCTQPENLSLHNFTQQPQNLSSQETNVTSQNHVVSEFSSSQSPQNLSNSHNSSLQIKFSQSQSTNFHSNSHLRHISSLSRFSEPQNLSNPQHSSFSSVLPQPQSLPQNLSLHQNITHPLMDHEQMLPQAHKLEAESILNLTTLQPENLTVPQNLSMTENVCQPQNLSLSQHISQPQNLSLNHSLSGSGNFSETYKFLQPQNLSRAINFSHDHNLPQAHNFSQPQNLSLMSNDEANNMQPQNLSIMSNIAQTSKNLISSQPQNLSYSDSISRTLISLPQNLSEPQNLSISHSVNNSGHQPQNLSQSHMSVSLSDHFSGIDENPHSLQMVYYS